MEIEGKDKVVIELLTNWKLSKKSGRCVLLPVAGGEGGRHVVALRQPAAGAPLAHLHAQEHARARPSSRSRRPGE